MRDDVTWDADGRPFTCQAMTRFRSGTKVRRREPAGRRVPCRSLRTRSQPHAYRDHWPGRRPGGEGLVENLIQDLTHGLRLLARRPGFAVVAVASLALGVGLNTTLFSVVNAVLLRDTPVQAPERLVEIYSSLSDDFPHLTTSYPDYLSIRDQADAFSGVAAHAFVRGILEDRGPAGADDGRDDHAELLRRARPPARARARLPRRRKRRRRTAPGGRAQPRAVAAAFRRPAGHPRPGDRDQRRPIHRRRRRTRGLLRDGARLRIAVLGPRDDGRPAQLPGHPERAGPRSRRDADRAGAASAGCS